MQDAKAEAPQDCIFSGSSRRQDFLLFELLVTPNAAWLVATPFHSVSGHCLSSSLLLFISSMQTLVLQRH